MATKRIILAALVSAIATPSSAVAQPAPQKITVGIYAPSIEFGTAQARLAYVQALAKAIEQKTGIKTEAQSYANVAALKKDNVDFAIIDGQCFATNLNWKFLAAANIGGGTTRMWALFTGLGGGGDIPALAGKKLAYIQTGCNDAGFIDNAMMETDLDPKHFGSRVGKLDLSAALAEVASYKTAHAVFAPVGSVKGLTKLFDTNTVPNPAFVDVAGKLPPATVDKVAAAVTSYGGGGAVTSWTKGSADPYKAFAGKFAKVVKAGQLVQPELVRFDAKDVLAEQATLKDTAAPDLRYHVVRSPGARME